MQFCVEQRNCKGHTFTAIEPICSDCFFYRRNCVEGDIVGIAGSGDINEKEITRFFWRASHVLSRGIELICAVSKFWISVVSIWVLVLFWSWLDLLTEIAFVRLSTSLKLEEWVDKCLAIITSRNIVYRRILVAFFDALIDNRNRDRLINWLYCPKVLKNKRREKILEGKLGELGKFQWSNERIPNLNWRFSWIRSCSWEWGCWRTLIWGEEVPPFLSQKFVVFWRDWSRVCFLSLWVVREPM